MRGWIYLISNPAMPGLVKVGFSMKDPFMRAQDLGGTGIPHSFRVEYDALVDEPRSLEKKVHAALKNRHEAKEWFRCSVADALRVIRKESEGVSVYAERGGLLKFEDLPFPADIQDPDYAYEVYINIWDEIANAADDDTLEKDPNHPKNQRWYLRRALELGSADALLSAARQLRVRALDNPPKSLIQEWDWYEPGVCGALALKASNEIFFNLKNRFETAPEVEEIRRAEFLLPFYRFDVDGTNNKSALLHWWSVLAKGSSYEAYRFASYLLDEGDYPRYLDVIKAQAFKQNTTKSFFKVADAYSSVSLLHFDLSSAKGWAQKAIVRHDSLIKSWIQAVESVGPVLDLDALRSIPDYPLDTLTVEELEKLSVYSETSNSIFLTSRLAKVRSKLLSDCIRNSLDWQSEGFRLMLYLQN